MFTIIRKDKLMNDDYYKTTIKGNIAFFCTRCYKPILASTDYKDDTHGERDAEVSMNLSYHIKCPRCGYVFDWNDQPLDPNIAESIARLNIKGYKTLFSCEGHSNHDYAYIYFRYHNQRHVLKYIPIEEPWYQRINSDNIFMLEPYGLKIKQKNSTAFCIEADKNSKLEDRVKALDRWVRRLPVCNTSVFYKKYIKIPMDSEIIK